MVASQSSPGSEVCSFRPQMDPVWVKRRPTRESGSSRTGRTKRETQCGGPHCTWDFAMPLRPLAKIDRSGFHAFRQREQSAGGLDNHHVNVVVPVVEPGPKKSGPGFPLSHLGPLRAARKALGPVISWLSPESCHLFQVGHRQHTESSGPRIAECRSSRSESIRGNVEHCS